jgi:SAM-dependent methyltransferase
MATIHYTYCPVCNSDKLKNIFPVKDYLQSGKKFMITECADCTLRFTQDAPDQEHIGAYYKSEDYISHTNTDKGLVNHLYQKVRNITMKQKAGIIKKYTGIQNGSLLDVGCGTGHFLHAMFRQGWKVAGLEPDADARAMAQQLYDVEIKPSHEIFSLREKQFQAITLWHVLEHVHQLHEYVAQLKNLLAADGRLFIAVPNYTSRDAKIYKQCWAAYDVPRHLYHFSPQSFNVLMQQHGLKIIKHLPMWFDSFYVSLLSSKNQSGKTNFANALLHGLSSNMNALRNVKECSSIIYVMAFA